MPRMRSGNRGGAREGAGRPATGTHERSSNRRVETLEILMGEFTYEEVAKSFIKFTEDTRGSPFHDLLKACIWRTGSYGQVLRGDLETAELLRKLGLQVPKPVEPVDGLSTLLHNRLSKRTYMRIQSTTNDAIGVKLLPSYYQVVQSKQLCRPTAGIVYTEVKCSVNLRDLVHHTLKRIFEHLHDEIDERLREPPNDTRDLTFIFSYGFDAATGQKMYSQAYAQPENSNRSSNSLFAANMNPLMLKECDGTSIWRNPVPQSPWFVRPLILEDAKETNAYVTEIKDDLQRQIDECGLLRFTTAGGVSLRIRIHPVFSMIDGKVFNFLTGTTSRLCPTCGCGPDDFNVEANITSGRFRPTEEGLAHGCQPLHAWMRFFCHIMNLACNKPVHDAKARGDAARELRESKKRDIQRKLLKDGLRVDFPAPNGRGSSTDGNTCRRAFAMYGRLALVTGVNEELIKRYWIILVCVNNTRWKLKVKQFRDYCLSTFRHYIGLYQWYKLPASVHKILFHSHEIQQRLELPVGVYSEGAQETTHRQCKDIKIDSTRKNSPLNTKTDLMNRRLDNSDPIIATKIISRCAEYRKTDEEALAALPEEARRLLEIPRGLRPAAPLTAAPNQNRLARPGVQPDVELVDNDAEMIDEDDPLIPLDDEAVLNYEYHEDEAMDED